MYAILLVALSLIEVPEKLACKKKKMKVGRKETFVKVNEYITRTIRKGFFTLYKELSSDNEIRIK